MEFIIDQNNILFFFKRSKWNLSLIKIIFYFFLRDQNGNQNNILFYFILFS